MKFFYQVSSLTFLTVSAVIGAGFLSGREIVAFFGTETFLPFFILSFFIVAASFLLCYITGESHKNPTSLYAELFLYPNTVRVAVLVASFISAAGSLAGIGSVFAWLIPDVKIPFFRAAAVVASCFIAKFGVKGVEKVSLVLTPVIILTVIILTVKGGKTDFSVGGGNVIIPSVKTLLYASMNCFINLPAIIDGAQGKSRPSLITSAVLSALIISALGILIAAAVKGARTENADMPFLFAAGGNPLFFAGLSFALITSLFSAFYPLYSFAGEKSGAAGKIFIAAGVFLFSFIGIKGIIDVLYPVIGAFGAVFLIKCAVFNVRRVRYKKDKP